MHFISRGRARAWARGATWVCGSHTRGSRDAHGTQGSHRWCARNDEFWRGCGCDPKRLRCQPQCRRGCELATERRAWPGFRLRNRKVKPQAGRSTERQRKRGDEVACATDVTFSCIVKTQKRWSNKIYKTKLKKIRYKNQVLCKYQVDPQRAGLTLIAELTWSNLGLKGVLNK